MLPKLGFRPLHAAALTKTHSKLSRGSRGEGKTTKKTNIITPGRRNNKAKQTKKHPEKPQTQRGNRVSFPGDGTTLLQDRKNSVQTLSVPLTQALNQENNAPILLQECPHLSAAMRKGDRWRKGVWEVAGSAPHPKSEARGQTWLLPRSGERLFAR